MQKRKFDELISHFNRKVSDMSIDQKYKMELLGMISAIGFAHEKELGTNLAEVGTDCISRQAAIEALKQQAETMNEWSNRYAEQRKGILTAVNIVEDLPPVQLGTDLASLGTDCISRQDALEAFGLSEKTRKYGGDHSGYDTMMMYEIQDTIENLPPIQPEIVRCKDCKHFIREDVEEYTPYGYDTHFHAFCDKHWDEEQGEYIDVNLDGYCSFAERREVTT